VVPRTALAEAAGLATGNGILVDERLQASIPGHYAAGDVANYLHRGERTRVEHWVHAQRQGQVAAANLLGAAQAFRDVPFFWTHQHDLELRYTGVGAGWDEARIDGTLASRDFTVRYYRNGALVAAAACGRDRENLDIEAALHDAA
jgi:NADPH-dependent 2,4-dienoyl-CoA reductase/sulfur reductase-like enzyme